MTLDLITLIGLKDAEALVREEDVAALVQQTRARALVVEDLNLQLTLKLSLTTPLHAVEERNPD